MAGSYNSSDDDIIAGINVTPLVDVVLVLLIIFMITAPVLYQSALKVQLPQAKTGESSDQKTSLHFTLTKSGELAWDNKPIDWQALPQQLTAMKDELPQKTAVISADQATPHGTVIKLMDTLRQAGLTHFAMNVESPAAGH